jgi:membrane protein DedA with SNARE-associated domain
MGLADWAVRLINDTGYVGVFFLMLLETLFPPIPSEVIMPLAGVAAARGSMTLGGVIAAGTAGAMFGNFFWYLAARVIGMERFKPFIARYGRWLTMDWYDVKKAEHLFGRHGHWVVFIARMMPTLRSIVSVPAGLLKMRLRSFLIWSTIGTAGWSAGLAVAGWALGRRFREVETILGPLSTAVIVLIIGAYVWRQFTWRNRHPEGEGSES